MPQTVNVAVVQQASPTNNKQENLKKAITLVKEAAAKGAQIVCLPELFQTTYFCKEEKYDLFSLAEPVPGPATDALSEIARQEGVVILASLFENVEDTLFYNTAAVIDADGTYLGKYRKMHIPHDPGFFEKFYFTPGDMGYKVFETRYGRVGTLICWDQWFPEAARLTAMQGADFLFYTTAIGWPTSQDEEYNKVEYNAWQSIQRGHAIANGIHVITANRTGTEDDTRFWGGSFISDPFGKILHQAKHDAEGVHVQEIDLEKNKFYRLRWPFFRDRRTDSYEPLTQKFSK